MSFLRYPKYKDSGADWLCEVPDGWELCRLKRTVAECRNGTWGDEAAGDEWDLPCIRVADFDRTKLSASGPFPTVRNVGAKERAGRILRKGNLLLEKSGGGDLQPVGCVVIYEDEAEAVCSNFVARMALVEGVNSSFCRYLHSAMYAVRITTRSINQTSGIQNLDQGAYLNEMVALPTLDEQKVIAAFLDRETAKIVVLIEKQRRLIELLKEKRQAVVSDAVTNGRDSGAEIAASGFAWLGCIPSHWSIKRASRLFQASKGPSAAMLTKEFCATNAGEFPVYSGQTENEGMIGSWNTFEFDTGQESAILATTVGSDKVMFIRHVRDRFSLSQNCMVIRPLGDEISTKFAFFHFAPLFSFQKGLIPQHMQASFRMSDFYKYPIAVPPMEEQRAICDYLESQLQSIDLLMAEAEKSILLLQERRSALISAAVTGKIDVRQPVRKPVASVKPYSSGFAHQLLAAKILSRCNDSHMGRTKLQKLIHVTEYHAQIEELQGDYTRKMAGPLDMKAIKGLETGLERLGWFKTVEESNPKRYRYVRLGKHEQHAKYLERWSDKQARIDEVLTLMGGMNMRQCEIVSTLYAAWNDLLIDGLPVSDDAILTQATTADGWHESKGKTPRYKWLNALGWMKKKGLVPTGFGSHTKKAKS